MDVFDYIKHGPKSPAITKGTGGLRGTRARTSKYSYSMSTQAQINALRRAVNRNAAELQTFRKQRVNYPRSGTGVEATIDISLSELLKSDLFVAPGPTVYDGTGSR